LPVPGGPHKRNESACDFDWAIRSASAARSTSAELRAGSNGIGVGACSGSDRPSARSPTLRMIAASRAEPPYCVADRIALSMSAGEARVLANVCAEASSIRMPWSLAMRATIALRTERRGLGNLSARFMQRTIAGPSRSASLTIQIVGLVVLSTKRFINALLARRREAFESPTPRNRSSASSTTIIVPRAIAPIALPITSAAMRSLRLGSEFSSLTSPTNWTERPR